MIDYYFNECIDDLEITYFKQKRIKMFVQVFFMRIYIKLAFNPL